MQHNNKKYGNPAPAPIVVTYRNNEGKRMHAAFFDHYLVRKITNHATVTSAPAGASTASFNSFIARLTHTFTLGLGPNIGARQVPQTMSETNLRGLLLIPGRAKEDNDAVRMQHELDSIRKARYTGQPVLAICAGSWLLWEAHGGQVMPVTDHCYSGMPYITSKGVVGNNVQIHRIQLEPTSLVNKVMQLKGAAGLVQNPVVNSMHWQTPNTHAPAQPAMLTVSARSVRDNDLAPKSRQGVQMQPTEDSVEAFESRHGVPMMGIQWHPEAYFNGQKSTTEDKRHMNILKYMAAAGDTYQAKQTMLVEFKAKVPQIPSIPDLGFFKPAQKTGDKVVVQQAAGMKNIQ